MMTSNTDEKIKCVLLIDDDEPTNILHQIIIEDAGVTNNVKVAQNGLDALEYLNKCKHSKSSEAILPDLIFLDINMPGMNGFEFLESYQKLPPELRTGIVIVMLTTSLNPYDMEKLNNLGVKALKNKPLTESILSEILDDYFSHSQQNKL